MKRFLVDKITSQYVSLDGAEFNHMRNVLRMQVSDQVVLNCGDGFDYHATIENMTKSSATLQVISKEKNIADSRCDVTVFQALVKGDNMSLIVQKCTELGVNTFVPFESKFITAKDKLGKAEKLQVIANQSTKQCKRSKPMQVNQTLSFKEMLDKLSQYDIVIFANETEKSNALSSKLSQYNRIALIVGSEGGFDKDEIDAINAKGAKSISMGNRILRAETAAIALTSVVMYLVGEWNYES